MIQDKRLPLKEAFLDYYRQNPVIKEAAKHVGRDSGTIMHWRKTDEEFNQEFIKASIKGEDEIKGEAEKTLNILTIKEGFVYLLRCEKYFKIGVAKNVEERMIAHQISCPFEIIYIGKFWCLDAVKTERKLHEKFRDKKIRGEWFELNMEDVNYIVGFSNEESKKHKQYWEDVRAGKKKLHINYKKRYEKRRTIKY